MVRDPESRQWEGLEVSARPGEQARPGPGPDSGGVEGTAGLPQGWAAGARGSGPGGFSGPDLGCWIVHCVCLL